MMNLVRLLLALLALLGRRVEARRRRRPAAAAAPAAVLAPPPAAAAARGALRRARLLVAYVAGRDAVSARRLPAVTRMWSNLQREYLGWSLSCLQVFGGHLGPANFSYSAAPPHDVCAELSLRAADGYLQLGDKVKALIVWAASHAAAVGLRFDYLLKTDVDTFTCFSYVADMLDAARLRFGADDRLFLGHIETCSQIQHQPGDRFYDAAYRRRPLLDCGPGTVLAGPF